MALKKLIIFVKEVEADEVSRENFRNIREWLTADSGLEATVAALQADVDSIKARLAVLGTYNITNNSTNRAYNASSVSTNELSDVLATLINDLKTDE